MFIIAFLVAILGYIILDLGFAGLLYNNIILGVSLIFWIIFSFIYKKDIEKNLKSLFRRVNKLNITVKNVNLQTITFVLLLLLVLVNGIGVLGPELGFDALWYHLTLPKLYLKEHAIFYIPGGLLYYSTIPKLTEMLYLVGLAGGSEVYAKIIHFSFGVLSTITVYKLARLFTSKQLSLLASLIFYGNLVVAWESISSYVDLSRTFFEVLSVLSFFYWLKTKDKHWFIQSAVLLGIAISVKLLAVTSLAIMIPLIFLSAKKKEISSAVANSALYTFLVLLIPLPWFLFSFISTHNPIYPFFTSTYPVTTAQFSPVSLWVLFTRASDPISPVYIIFFPIVFLFFKRFSRTQKYLALYSFLAVLVWTIVPNTGGGRFILPYLPVFSVLVVLLFEFLPKQAKTFGLSIIILTTLLSVFYRSVANFKFIPVLLGKESKSEFLQRHLNFDFGDFYDVDSYFALQINSKDKVLLYGFHNLYYVNFPFLHESTAKKGDTFTYIAVQNSTLPFRFKNWTQVYANNQTKVSVFSLNGKKGVF